MEIALYPKVLNRRQAGFVHQTTLPSPDVIRWTFRRKAAVVTAVASGEITRVEACRRYRVSAEEFLSWQQAFEAHGAGGLRVTRLQAVSSWRRTTLKARARLRRVFYTALDNTAHLLMLARLRLDDWLAGPMEKRTERAIQGEGEQSRDVHSPR
jgi:transposase-like protein